MIKYIAGLILISIAGLLSACGGATVDPPPSVELQVTVTEGPAVVARQLGKQFTASRPHVTVSVTQANAAQSLNRLAAGTADLAVLPWLPPGAEQFQATPFARGGLAIIVHPDNPVKNLTLRDLQNLYAGRVYNWRDVEGIDQQIQVIIRERGSGLRAVFEARIMNGERITPNARILPKEKAVVDFVAQNPEAIGYVSLTALDQRVHVVSVEDVLPDQANIVNGAYPLTYILYVLAAPDAEPLVNDLATLFIRPAGQELVFNAGLAKIN